MPLLGLIGTMYAVAVDLAGTDIADPAMEELISVFGQFDPLEFLLAAGVEQAQLHARRIG